ncbi:chromosome condensation regulator [Pelomyxa schiedti]|nr:chromosome condensation regulator [Pelomyxa schiedti]
MFGQEEDPVGEVWSWGSNVTFSTGHFEVDNAGELLPEQRKLYSTPRYVTSLEGDSIIMVACGQGHTMALTTGLQLWAWGKNDFGQLGLGDKRLQIVPRRVTSLTEQISMAACGLNHTIALTTTGNVYTWGEGRFGRLGHGPTMLDDLPSPLQVASLPAAKGVFAGGNQTAIITEDGTLFTWGWNGNGQLGLGFTNDILSGVPIPTQVGETNRRLIDYIDRHAIREGEVSRIGNQWELLISTVRSTLLGLQDRAARELSRLFQRTDNAVKEEQIKLIQDVAKNGGRDESTSRLLELLVQAFHELDLYKLVESEGRGTDTAFVKIAIGERHMVGITPEKKLYTWGCNGHGQLGRLTEGNRDSLKPAQIENFPEVTDVSCGMAHTVAISNGVVFSWGHKEAGRLGYDITSITDERKPRQVPGVTGAAIQVSCGEHHTAVLCEDHTVMTWGFNNSGQCGYTVAAEEESRPVGHPPTTIARFSGISFLSSGCAHIVTIVHTSDTFCQLCRDGDLKAIKERVHNGTQPAHEVDRRGRTGFFYAIEFGRMPVINYLLDVGCQVDPTDKEGFTPLHIALTSGQKDCVKLLLSRKCNLKKKTIRDGHTPLHIAAISKNVDMVQLLVINGSPLDIVDSSGKTALDYLDPNTAQNIRSLIGRCDIAVLCAPQEQTFAQKLATSIRNYDLSVWADDTPAKEVMGGEDSVLYTSIMHRLTNSRAVVWIVSRNSLNSERAKTQLFLAKQLEKPLFPIWFDVVTDLPGDVEQIIYRTQLVDFSPAATYQESVVKLVHGLQLALEGRSALQQESSDEPTLSEAEMEQQKSKMATFMTESQKRPYLFVCFHWSDRRDVNELQNALETHNWLCYPGYNKVHTTQESSDLLLNASACLFCLSQTSCSNALVREQTGFAENHGVPLFPVQLGTSLRLDPAMQYSLARAPSFFFNGPHKKAAVDQLLHSLNLSMYVRSRELEEVSLRKQIKKVTEDTASEKLHLAQLREILAEMERKAAEQKKAGGGGGSV